VKTSPVPNNIPLKYLLPGSFATNKEFVQYCTICAIAKTDMMIKTLVGEWNIDGLVF